MYRGTTSGGESPTPIATGVVGTSFTNTGLTVGTTYFYVVTAVKGALQSVHSNEASASPNFTDTFHRANSTNLGSNWTTFIGQMGISGNMAAGQSGVVDLAQVNGISLTNAAVSAVTNVGTTGERYAGVFARRDAAGDMYVAMLGVNSAANPAGSPTAALLFRFTPGLAGTVSGGWSFLTFTLLPTPPNTGSANLGLDVTGTGLATTLHLYLNGTLTLTFVESQAAAIGVSHHPLNNRVGWGCSASMRERPMGTSSPACRVSAAGAGAGGEPRFGVRREFADGRAVGADHDGCRSTVGGGGLEHCRAGAVARIAVRSNQLVT